MVDINSVILTSLSASKLGMTNSEIALKIDLPLPATNDVVRALVVKKLVEKIGMLPEGALYDITEEGRAHLAVNDKLPLLQWTPKLSERVKKAVEPAHYKGKTIEVFDVLNEFLSDEAVNGFFVGNVIKYVLRYKDKNGKEDLLKAKSYLEKLINGTV